MEGEIDLHGHEPSVGISNFFAKFFKEGCFNFPVIIFFIRLRIYTDEGTGEPGDKEFAKLEGGDGVAGGASRSKYCVQVRSPDGVVDCKWGPLGGGQNRK